jgi:hypothetical protein
MDELISIALKEGLGYGMFACLLVYVLKTTGERIQVSEFIGYHSRKV